MNSPAMNLEPVILTGRFVRLEPLSLVHVAALAEVGTDESIWRWNPSQVVRSEADMRHYVDHALQQHASGQSLPFATVHVADNRAIGSTRFANFDHEHRRVEIGYTWIAPSWQRSAANTEAKYLMLGYAFEAWGCIRVEFKTDSLNQKSRNALARIGALEEGTLRNHMLTHSGRIRHSVYFSITDAEWPRVKADLAAKLAR
ncbi:MAG: GNAT family N-acetyltransferase [Deltaproteobacteria bacterium]|nr:GNAT family N-acetyltransferase [Deltaproteobacteria bacterium]